MPVIQSEWFEWQPVIIELHVAYTVRLLEYCILPSKSLICEHKSIESMIY